MPGFVNGTLVADNVDFRGINPVAPQVTTDGELLIGSTAAPNIKVGTLTSPSGTITIGYASPNITIDLAGGSVGIDSIAVQAVTAPGVSPVLPTGAGLMTVNGAIVAAQAVPLQSRSIALNSYQIEAQYSSAQAVDTPTASGMCHFDSAQFAVSTTGFVQSLASVAFVWQDSGPVAMAIFNGYFATGAGAYTLPLGVADGETIEIVDQVGGGVVVTAAGAQIIQVQNTSSSAGGTCTSTQSGDCLRLVYRASAGRWLQAGGGAGGNWILA